MKQLPTTRDMTFQERLNEVSKTGGTFKSPIVLHATHAVRQARKLPLGAARNDLRRLAKELRALHRSGAYARLQKVEGLAIGAESVR